MNTREGDDLFADAATHVLAAERRGAHEGAAWRDADRANDAAYLAALAVLEVAPDLRRRPGYADLMGAPTLRERFVTLLQGIAGYLPAPDLFARPVALAAVALIALASTMWLVGSRAPGDEYRTAIAQLRTIRLNDGSTVTLGAQSSIRVALEARERRVTLDGGEAFFEVAHDATWPFTVAAGDTLVTVTGTRFEVKRSGAKVRVAVLEGSVRVASGPGGPPTAAAIRLGAGEQAVAALDRSVPIRDAAPAISPGGWREGRMSYHDAPLAEIIADANRYRVQPIRVESAALAQARLTTSFRSGQINQMVATLPDTLPLTVHERADGSVDLLPR